MALPKVWPVPETPTRARFLPLADTDLWGVFLTGAFCPDGWVYFLATMAKVGFKSLFKNKEKEMFSPYN